MPLSLSDFDAVTFDVYGTLIDWEPGIIDFLRRWADCNAISAPAQDLLMAFDRARAEVQKERPAHLYPDVLRRPRPEIALAVLGLEAGFETEDLAVIGEQDILGDRLVRRSKNSAIGSLSEL